MRRNDAHNARFDVWPVAPSFFPVEAWVTRQRAVELVGVEAVNAAVATYRSEMGWA